jgi:dynamin 1-like protein
MDSLIGACVRLHEVLKPVGNYHVTLPWVVAVGGQSSGKSSVLENIVGR